MNRVIPVLVNRSGGTAAAMGEKLRPAIESAFGPTGREIALEFLTPAEMPSAISRHVGAPMIVVGGGDGTMGTAASILAGTPSAMGILPLGTRNHLARQLGVPLDLAEAVRLTVYGQRRRIDLGAANDRVFVNNASFGIYTRLVRQREMAKGPKWLKTIPATWHALRHMRAQLFPVRIDGQSVTLITPLLFVGNNAYLLRLGELGERESLNDGALSIFAVSAESRAGLIGLALRALVGLADPQRDFAECASAREMEIEGEGLLEGAFDGELETLSLPLTLRILPSALGVVTPRETVPVEAELSHPHSQPHS